MTQDSSSLSSSSSEAPPKVFISYSWTSPGHRAQVREWAERLLNDGVDVVIDIFDLKEGHDKYHFMERMITDPQVTHVLVVCDKSYAEKANAKEAGVGTESQIISSEVYGKVDQSKFIPIVCEFSDEREPMLPVLLKSRIWIDFSSPEAANQNWEQLVRLLYGKPAYRKPQVGRAPAYLTASRSMSATPALGKFNVFKQAFLSNANGLNKYREDFISSCIDYADTLRIKKDPQLDGVSFAQKVLEDCGLLREIRNLIVDWILLESGETTNEDFQNSLLALLESLLELKARPEAMNSWNGSWFEAESIFVYETFLYVVAALLKTKSYKALHEIFTSSYLKPKSDCYDDNRLGRFGLFYGYSEALQLVLAPEGQKLHSAAAEMIKRQADRSDLIFPSIMEAELLVLLMVLIGSDIDWHPQTLYYKSQVDFPFFVRAAQHRHFLNLATVTGISDANVLRELVKQGYERLRVNQWHGFFMSSRSFWQCLNLDRLDSAK